MPPQSKDLHELGRNGQDLRKVIDQIADTCDPFQNLFHTPESLYNISSGRASSEAARKCLLSVPETGAKHHREFVEACKDDPAQFEQPYSLEKPN